MGDLGLHIESISEYKACLVTTVQFQPANSTRSISLGVAYEPVMLLQCRLLGPVLVGTLAPQHASKSLEERCSHVNGGFLST